MSRPPLLPAVALVALAVAPCCRPSDANSGSLPSGPPEPLPDHFAAAWVGTYLGAGSGTVGSKQVTLPDARLTVAFDADSVRTDRCPRCVTVTLDTFFALANVILRDPVRLSLSYVGAGYRRTLLLDRFSGGGRTANVLQGRLFLEVTDGTGDSGDIAYLLELR